MKNRRLLFLASFLGFIVLILLRLTVRIRRIGEETLFDFYRNKRHFILAFWHGRQLMMPYSYRGKQIHILISQHGDGEIVARAMSYFGFHSVRGSTTRGGFRAFRELIRISGSSDLAITPDGPKGPPRRVQMGIIELARLTALPIIPVTFGSSSARRLNSWDCFEIPFPFSRGIFIWGKPVRVEKNAGEGDLILKQRELEDEMNRITDLADGYYSNQA